MLRDDISFRRQSSIVYDNQVKKWKTKMKLFSLASKLFIFIFILFHDIEGPFSNSLKHKTRDGEPQPVGAGCKIDPKEPVFKKPEAGAGP